jgi:hypothetical protein
VQGTTGAPLGLALCFVVANLVQAWLFAWLFRRWLPQLWGGGGEEPLAKLSHLWRLLAAAFLSTAAGAVIGPTGVWAVNGVYSWPATAVWLTRNTVSILMIGVAGICLGPSWREHRKSSRHAGMRAAWAGVPLRRRLEYVSLRDTDIVARLGGDEFAFLLHECTESDAPMVVARICSELDAAGVEASIGWAAVTITDGFTTAIEEADAAMYSTKLQRRKNRMVATAPRGALLPYPRVDGVRAPESCPRRHSRGVVPPGCCAAIHQR